MRQVKRLLASVGRDFSLFWGVRLPAFASWLGLDRKRLKGPKP